LGSLGPAGVLRLAPGGGPVLRRPEAKAELHNGQYVTAIGTPPTVSLTISCQIRIWTG
jgi:hypothetical protein